MHSCNKIVNKIILNLHLTVSSLVKKYRKASDQLESSREAFEELDASADPDMRDEWRI
jgi:hypothetical protein